METKRIYVDFDDCLCETALYFTVLVKKLFGKDVPYSDVKYFDLQRSFSLTAEQYEYMMLEAHKPEALLSFEETPGASGVLNSWVDSGFDVSVITGRPFSAFEPSREWLDRHGLDRVKMFCLNKYGRDSFIKNSDFNLEIEDYYKLYFDYAVEDSPSAFKFFGHLPNLNVLVYQRPWNSWCELPGDNFVRCPDWETIRRRVAGTES